jgi:hypothetical protein
MAARAAGAGASSSLSLPAVLPAVLAALLPAVGLATGLASRASSASPAAFFTGSTPDMKDRRRFMRACISSIMDGLTKQASKMNRRRKNKYKKIPW